jgi:hypothetical protein
MGRGVLKITKTEAANSQIHDRYVSQTQIPAGTWTGGTGGLTSQVGRQIQPVVYITGGSQTNGSIKLQKGRKTFLATDGTRTGDVMLVNSGTLAAGQAYILVTKADTTTFYAARICNKFVHDWDGNKYRYHLAAATTSNTYVVDYAAGTVGFVQVAYA